MDSSELNKIAGGLIGAFLVFMLLNFFSDLIFHGGHHGDEEVLAYAVEIETGGAEDPVEEISVTDLLAAATADDGKKVYRKCGACHKADKNGVGPMLGGVVGRDIASVDGFGYSGGLQAAEGDWDAEKLFAFLGNPKEWGSSMSFNLKDEEDRAAVVRYLETLQ